MQVFEDKVEFRHRNRVLVTIEGEAIAKDLQQGLVNTELQHLMRDAFPEYIGCRVVADYNEITMFCGKLEK
jgi:hypothetical protein